MEISILRIGDNVSYSVTYTENDVLYIESQEYGIEEKNMMHEEGD